MLLGAAEPVFLNVYGDQELIPNNEFRSLCYSLVGRFNNPIATWCLAPTDYLKIPAQFQEMHQL